jgi:transposase InsO family protein
MLVKPRKRYARTTDSRHGFNIHPNLAEGFTPTGKNQLWVSDITYIRTMSGFLYLALITDAYSRKIVGYDISDSLELEGALRALRKALSSLPADHRLIHHSDRGIQYCTHAYVNKLKSKGIRISMAGKGNCYENAMAERVNGILKQEYYLDQRFNMKTLAIKACKQAVKIYNTHRLHMSLGYKTPEYVHNRAA